MASLRFFSSPQLKLNKNFIRPVKLSNKAEINLPRVKDNDFSILFKDGHKVRRVSGTNPFNLNLTTKRHFTTKVEETISLTHENDAYKVSIPLSNNERCLFAFRGDVTVDQFLEQLRSEDNGILFASLFSKDGSRIAKSAQLEHVLPSGVKLTINNNSYVLNPLEIAKASTSSAPVYVTVEGNSPAETKKVAELKKQIAPLFRQKRDLDEKANRMVQVKVWGGLLYLMCQGAILARFTWWDFNWDIIEPVSYFVTFGGVLLGYTYFAVTKREYTFGDMRQGWSNREMRKQYEKANFPTEKYYQLEYEIRKVNPDVLEELEEELDNPAPAKAAKAS